MKQLNSILVLALAGVACCFAQVDPSGRVGRISYASGSVSFEAGGADQWVPAPINRPLTTGDQLWADRDSSAELHVGTGALRLAANTSFEFLNLDDLNTQIRLAEGTLEIRLRELGSQEVFEVDTPNLAFTLLRPGEYRIDVHSDSAQSLITVRSGEGEVTGNGQAFTVHAREQSRVSATDQVSYDVVGAPPPDQFDRWCFDRDRREDTSLSARYVPRTMVGYQDLDVYGTWSDEPEYGAVWIPRGVPVGWAPYRFGHWAWIEPWGWTWVDDAQWGFAPFHYGRWAYVRGTWGWVPGPPAVRPVYAPALVAWVGGSHFSLSAGVGPSVAWVPLGPREVFVPSYHASPTYVTRVNTTNTIVNNVNVTNVYNNRQVTRVTYVNQTVANGVTAAPASALASGRPINTMARPVTAEQLRTAEVIRSAPAMPTRNAVSGSALSTGVNAPHPPAAVISRTVVARVAPPPQPTPSAQQPMPAHPLVRLARPAQGDFQTQSAPHPARPSATGEFVRPPAPPTAPAPPTPPSPPSASPGFAPLQRPAQPSMRPYQARPAEPARSVEAPGPNPARPVEPARPVGAPGPNPTRPAEAPLHGREEHASRPAVPKEEHKEQRREEHHLDGHERRE